MANINYLSHPTVFLRVNRVFMFRNSSSPARNSSAPSRFKRNAGSSSRRFGSNSSSRGRDFGPSTGHFRSRPTASRSFSRGPKKFRGESIDISRFIKKASLLIEEQPIQVTHAFTDFRLCNEIQFNLKKRNYSVPTPIQDQAIESILNGNDLIGLANTGTGKTAAFLLPLIDKVFRNRSEKVLIIAPTRELAQQIDAEFHLFSWNMRIFSNVCVGGLPIYRQIDNLRRNPSFVIGTPGRLKDLNERGVLKFDGYNSIVLDEVDRMLDMGFVDEIKAIMKQLPETRQSLFFSATMPPKIQELAREILKNPVTVRVTSGETAANVDQDVVRVRDINAKFDQLADVLNKPEVKKVLIFNETKRDVEKLTDNLLTRGFKAESIHGDKKQGQRQRALTQFRNDHINILVATDVAARGLDIKDVTHVINYTVPQTYDDYVHRIGRCGRANQKGFALTFVETLY